ncbi:hypothetical protein HBI80_013310 [Parastagonospora nodorum]|nr:hypothetical protein HBH50_111100 [Parastagonospora nodorum]KAH4088346.1 hypothetical protein HBH48_128070 [Parastagonospora nodorum]KAH4282568.1 hypothetical protein HBI04_033270 [Parastagonospora nodorum]KAH4429858.1 hypothetical protein HBH99_013530 [Parastagonospora nodorum]KAH4837543.1 hypothetical protein HBH60_011570 [Parastagonospora nodorum]
MGDMRQDIWALGTGLRCTVMRGRTHETESSWVMRVRGWSMNSSSRAIQEFGLSGRSRPDRATDKDDLGIVLGRSQLHSSDRRFT